jgi:hypothetical protein
MSSEIIHIVAYDNFDGFEGSHVQHQWPPQLWKWDGIFLQMCIEGKIHFVFSFYVCNSYLEYRGVHYVQNSYCKISSFNP